MEIAQSVFEEDGINSTSRRQGKIVEVSRSLACRAFPFIGTCTDMAKLPYTNHTQL
jgi:hypothetical protein